MMKKFCLIMISLLVCGAMGFPAAADVTITSEQYIGSKLTLSSNDVYVFPDDSKDVSIDVLILSGDVSDVTLTLPSYDVQGEWSFDFTSIDGAEVKLSIVGDGSASIALSNDTVWNIGSVDVVIGVPLSTDKDLKLKVSGYSSLTLGESADISIAQNTHITISSDVTLIVKNPSVVSSDKVSQVFIGETGTLSLDFAAGNVVITSSLDINGSLDVTQDAEVNGKIYSSQANRLAKTGTGTLALKAGDVLGSISDVTVKAGKLVFESSDIWKINAYSMLNVENRAEFEASSGSILKSASLDVNIKGSAIFADNAIKDSAENLTLNVEGSESKVTINGTQAFSKISGDGTLNVTDDGELIIVGASSDNYSGFIGTIKADNVGLYDNQGNTFDNKNFKGAEGGKITTLKVYGHAKLNISTLESKPDIANIWLKSYDNAVGSLIFETSVDLDSLKIDAISAPAGVATITASGDAEVTLSGITLCVNSEDISSMSDIYALSIDSSAKGSRIIISEVTGDGLSADLAQVYIALNSDVEFKGTGSLLGNNISLLVGQNAKLEMSKGAILNGHLEFEGSSNIEEQPSEEWFKLAECESLDHISVLTTQTGASNREVDGDAEYSVKVSGDISTDSTTFIRVVPEDDLLNGADSSSGQRFKILGTEGSLKGDFKLVSNDDYNFIISKDEHGVVVEISRDFAIIELGDHEFISSSDAFGSGQEFAIKIPFTVKYQNQSLDVVVESSEVYLKLVSDDTELTFDPSDNWSPKVLNSEVITLTAEINSQDNYILLVGTSTQESVKVAIAFEPKVSPDTIPIIPDKAFRLYNFGIAYPELQWSQSLAEAVDRTDFTVGEEATVRFKVDSVRQADYVDVAMPVLVNGVYIWNDGTVTTNYEMLDNYSRPITVSTINLVIFDGKYLNENTPSRDIEALTEESFDVSGSSIIVNVPLSVLGDTGATFDAIKGLSIKGVRTDGNGDIITQPVDFTLHATVSEENIIAVSKLNNTVTIGGNSVSAVYDIDPDDLSGDVKLIKYSLPEWLGFYGDGSTLAYETKDLTGVEPGTYNFSVLAYSGQNALTSPHKLYTFNVEVNRAASPSNPTPSTPSTEPSTSPATSGDVSPDVGPVTSPDITPSSPDVEPTSPDVRPSSPDVEPTSPDVTPTSPDIQPTSPDVQPTSPDVRPTSPDVTPSSPDIQPTSPDIEPTSPDVGPGTPDDGPSSPDIQPTSPDVRPTSPDIVPSSPDLEPESPDLPPGPQPSEPGTQPVTIRPETPRVNIQEENVISRILNAIQAISNVVTQNTEVTELPASASTGEQLPLTREDIASIPETETITAALPSIRVERPAVYVFGVTLTDLRVGARIFLYMLTSNASASEFRASADVADAYTFLDDDGNTITTVPANKHVNVAAYMEPGRVYKPVITTTSDEEEPSRPGTLGSSGGGCNSGVSIFALILLGMPLISKRKR